MATSSSEVAAALRRAGKVVIAESLTVLGDFIVEGRDDEAQLARARVVQRARIVLAIVVAVTEVAVLALKAGTILAIASMVLAAFVVIVLALTGNISKVVDRLLARAESPAPTTPLQGPLLTPTLPSPGLSLMLVAVPLGFLLSGWYEPAPIPIPPSQADAGVDQPMVALSSQMTNEIKNIMGPPPARSSTADAGMSNDGGLDELTCVARVYSEWRSSSGKTDIETRYLDQGCWRNVVLPNNFTEEVWRVEWMRGEDGRRLIAGDIFMKLGGPEGVISVKSDAAQVIMEGQGLFACMQVQVLVDLLNDQSGRKLEHMHVDAWCGKGY